MFVLLPIGPDSPASEGRQTERISAISQGFPAVFGVSRMVEYTFVL
jgi:hypothetical protein